MEREQPTISLSPFISNPPVWGALQVLSISGIVIQSMLLR